MINNAVFGKTMENVSKHRNIQLVTKERRRNCLVSELIIILQSFCNRTDKTQSLINKLVYLGISILGLSKILMHEFWYDYLKPNYGEKTKLCYMDTDSFVVYIKTEDIYKDIAEDVDLQKMLKLDMILQFMY